MQIKSFILGFIAGVILTVAVVVGLALYAVHLQNQIGGKSMIPDSAFALCPKDGDANIAAILEPIRKKHKVPAICAAVVNSDGLVAAGAVGVRKIETDMPVTINDYWHLGSDTKAMTATLIGRLVEQGKLQWSSTLRDIFPELASEMKPELKSVTVLEILSHRAGFAENLNWQEFSKYGSLPKQRYEVVKKAIAQKPESNPGSKFSYSNLGYVIAGAIIEKITNSTWEEQIRILLFEQLQMTSCGFDGTGTKGKIDQPWGHSDNGAPVAANGPDMDNALVLAPAGCVHCSITDWSKLIADQLRGSLGKPALCKAETYKFMHTPPLGGDYALGWIVCQRSWGGGTVFNHGGSNTMNFANVWLAPQRDFAVLICVNQGGDAAFRATDEVAGELIKRYVRKN